MGGPRRAADVAGAADLEGVPEAGAPRAGQHQRREGRLDRRARRRQPVLPGGAAARGGRRAPTCAAATAGHRARAWCRRASTRSGTEAKRVLRAAGVFGETFRAAGVKALVGDEERRRRRVARRPGPARGGVPARRPADAREFVFRHALVRDAAYEMLTARGPPPGPPAGRRVPRGRRASARPSCWSSTSSAAASWCAPPTGAASPPRRRWTPTTWRPRSSGWRAACAAAPQGETLGFLRLTEAQARFLRGEFGEAEVAARAGGRARSPAPRRLQAFGELIAALGQQAKFAEVERWVVDIRSQPRRGRGQRARGSPACCARPATCCRPAATT